MLGVTVTLQKIDYRGGNIGSDISFGFQGTSNTTIRTSLSHGNTFQRDKLLHAGHGPIFLRVGITEHDLLVDDFGSAGIWIRDYGNHKLTVEVNEAYKVPARNGWLPTLKRRTFRTKASFIIDFFAAYASSGANAMLPSFSSLERHYPGYDVKDSSLVKSEIGGKVNYGWITNTCAIRLSQTLNYNSLELPKNFSGMNVVSGSDNKWYAFRVAELRKWLVQKIGNPQFEITKSANSSFDKRILKDVKGIIAFDIQFDDATGHFDLWNGQNFTSEQNGNSDYWNKASRISLWEAS